MRVVTMLEQLRDKQPVFGDKRWIYYVEKGYSDFNSKFSALEITTGALLDATPLIIEHLQQCISNKQLLVVNSNKLSTLENVHEPILWADSKNEEITRINFFRDYGPYVVKLGLEPYLKINKRIVEALVLVLTGKIDGDQFVKGILAVNQSFGLSENQLSLVKDLKITKIYTGGIKLETGNRIVEPSELYLER